MVNHHLCIFARLRHWFKRQAKDQNISHGKTILEKELRRLGLVDVSLDRLAREFEYRGIDHLYEAIGCGDIPSGKLVNHLTLGGDRDDQEMALVARPSAPSDRVGIDTVSVLGLRGLLTNMAGCCNPAPGDDIVGYIIRG